MNDEGISIGEGRVVKSTERAILVELETGEKVWIPNGCFHDDSEVWRDEQEGDVVVKRWFAEKEGLV